MALPGRETELAPLAPWADKVKLLILHVRMCLLKYFSVMSCKVREASKWSLNLLHHLITPNSDHKGHLPTPLPPVLHQGAIGPHRDQQLD